MNKFHKSAIQILSLLIVVMIFFACAGMAEYAEDEGLNSIESENIILDGGSDDTSGESEPITEAADGESKVTSESDDSRIKKEDSPSKSAALSEESLRSAEAPPLGGEELSFYEEEVTAGESAPLPVRGRTTAAPPSESGLKAGYSDDNKQFTYFVNFLKEYEGFHIVR